MRRAEQRRIEVCAHWLGLPGPTLMGVLYAAPSRGKEVFSFEYDETWLRSAHAQNLDPSLGLYGGRQYAPDVQENFGVFLDSSPDRWGRVLMQRREAQTAREEQRPQRRLIESDYLLGVHDSHRMGALRFRTETNGPFLDANRTLASPPWTSIRELENASLQLEREDAEGAREYASWIRLLIAPGGSLGGARPKASVVDPQGALWIAKFPSRDDVANKGGWEQVVSTLASRAGIDTPESQARIFTTRHHTFLTKRFDRTAAGERIHFASAMTLLQYSDGANYTQGVSYLELAEFLMRGGARADRDLEQLWRRIVFFICISNVDDHLRNHGFLLQNDGWVLSPAYDMNPNEAGAGLTLNISETDNSQDLELAREVAPYFRVRAPRVEEIIRQVVEATQGWRPVASSLGIPDREQETMAPAFRVADAS